jgi:hypothetical protein
MPIFYLVKITLLVLMLTSPMAISATTEYQEIEWTDLIPKDDLDLLLNPPAQLLEIEDGSAQDSITAASNSKQDEEVERYLNALSSSRIVEKYKKKLIKIPGFVVPLSSEDQRKITEFFIVPYFGACLHMPPPPPNQIIYVKYKQGIELKSLYEPFWFTGILMIETVENSMGSSAYSLHLNDINPYEEP